MDKLSTHPNIDDDEALPLIKDIYDSLITHLMTIRNIYQEGLEIKKDFEGLVGLNNDDISNLE